VAHEEQELLTLPEHLSSTPVLVVFVFLAIVMSVLRFMASGYPFDNLQKCRTMIATIKSSNRAIRHPSRIIYYSVKLTNSKGNCDVSDG